MKISTVNYNNPKQGYLPLFLSDCLDLLDPVLTFDRLMGGIDLNKYPDGYSGVHNRTNSDIIQSTC